MKTPPPFEPRNGFRFPAIKVRPTEQPNAILQPFCYYLNPYVRHHEGLSGMAGDWQGNRFKKPR